MTAKQRARLIATFNLTGLKPEPCGYTQALTDLEGLQVRMFHRPVGERLVANLQDHYGIEAVAATKVSQHHENVFRIDRRYGDP